MTTDTPKFALTIWAPWAQAIVRGPKLIENRTLKPPDKIIGERIAIHCGKTLAKPGYYDDEKVRAQLDEAHRYMIGEGVTERGHIIGTARVVGYLSEADDGSAEYRVRGVSHDSLWWRLTDNDHYWGGIVLDNTWWTGPVGWLLDDVRELTEPVAARGMPGVWTIEDEVREAMEEK